MKHKLLLSIMFCAAIVPAAAQFTVTSGDDAKNDTLSGIYNRKSTDYDNSKGTYGSGLKRLTTPKDTFTCFVILDFFKQPVNPYNTSTGKDNMVYTKSGKDGYCHVEEYIGLDGKKHVSKYYGSLYSTGSAIFYIENQNIEEYYEYDNPKLLRRYSNYGGDQHFYLTNETYNRDSVVVELERRLFIPNNMKVVNHDKLDYRNMREARVTATVHCDLWDRSKSYVTFGVKYYECPQNYKDILRQEREKHDAITLSIKDESLKEQMDMAMENYYKHGTKKASVLTYDEKYYKGCKNLEKAKNMEYPEYKKVRNEAKTLDRYAVVNGKRIDYKK